MKIEEEEEEEDSFTETWTAQEVTKRIKDRGVGRSVSSLVTAGELQKTADEAAASMVLFNHRWARWARRAPPPVTGRRRGHGREVPG